MAHTSIRASLVVLLLLTSACDEADCIIPPCAPPVAIEVTVNDESTGAAVAGVSFSVTGSATGGGPCGGGKCVVIGGPGTYELDITAPGYTTSHRRVEVQGSTPDCGCTTVETQRWTVALIKTI